MHGRVKMLKKIAILATLAVAALGAFAWAKSDLDSAVLTTLSFSSRWEAVDEAIHSGKFIVRQTDAAKSIARQEQIGSPDRRKVKENHLRAAPLDRAANSRAGH